MIPARTSRRTRPAWALAFPTLVVLGASVVFVFLTIGDYRGTERSEATQHGVRMLATVEAVTNHSEQTRSGTRHSATLELALPRALNGIDRSTAHLPYRSDDTVGTQIVALVDPQQPDYAELPGSPIHRTVQWVVALVATLVFLVLLAFLVRTFTVALRRRGWTGRGATLS